MHPTDCISYSSFQLHASSSVGAILVIAQGGAGQGEYKIRPYTQFQVSSK